MTSPNHKWIYTYAYEPRQIWEPWETEAFPPKWIEQEATRVVEQIKTSEQTLAFILLTDTHVTENGTWKYTAESISQICKRTKINGIIHLGDFTDGMVPKQKTIEDVQKILSDLEQNNVPVYAAIGNHDYNYFHKNPEIFTRQELKELYKNELNYSVDLQNLRFIFLDSYKNDEALRYGFDKEALDFLSAELEKNKAIIFSHLPPMAALQAWVKEIRGEKEIMEILNRNSKNIIAFINGHNHCDLIYNENFPIVSINNAKCEYFLEHKPPNATVPFRKLGEAIQESFDIMLVEPEQGNVKFIRFGAGQNRISPPTPHLKNWQDFESLRDPSKTLIIYGAGNSGKHFLNVNKLVPDYFADRNFAEIKEVVSKNKKVKVPCISPQEMEKIIEKQAADVIVSILSDIEIETLRSIFFWFKQMNLHKNTIVYFFHEFNVERGCRSYYEEPVCINGECVILGEGLFFVNNFHMMPNHIFKKAIQAFHNKNLTRDDYHKILYKESAIYKNGVLARNPTLNFGTEISVYLLSACVFQSFYSQENFRIHILLQSILNETKINFIVKHITAPNSSFHNVILHNLQNLPIKDGDIVIATQLDKLELILQAKFICEKQGARFVAYIFPNILAREYLSDFEKIIVKKCKYKDYLSQKSIYKKQREQYLDHLNFLNIEAYEPPQEFFHSKETILLDSGGSHFGEYGNEIIAKHLFDIVTEKITFKKNFKKDIENAMIIISIVIPEIYLYADELKRLHKSNFQNCGSIVMNCNPFTLGHLHLIEYAASQVEFLYIFVVEEDKSEFKFKDRYFLVQENVKHLKNVKVLPSGKFIISNQTFGEYFSKAELTEEEKKPDVSLDLLIFAAAIAPTLNIKTRFVGEEPLDHVTKHYNEQMKITLPKYGCEVVEIPRKKANGLAISASRVRKLLEQKNFEEIKKIVPKATYEFLLEN